MLKLRGFGSGFANALVDFDRGHEGHREPHNSRKASQPRGGVFGHGKKHARHQHHCGHFVEQSVRGGRPRRLAAGQGAPHAMPKHLVGQKQRHKPQFEVHPRLVKPRGDVVQHADAEDHRQEARRPRDGKPEPALHDAELGDEGVSDGAGGLVLRLAVVDKQPKHVEEAREPRDDEDDVQGLEEGVRHLQCVAMHEASAGQTSPT